MNFIEDLGISKLHSISRFLLLSFLLVVFTLEGLGIKYGREISYYLILMMPFLLFSFYREELRLPKKIAVLFVLFFFFTGISTIFSVNIQRSFEQLILYCAVLLIFIYVFNNKEKIEKLMIPFIFGFSFLFSIYSLILNFFIAKEWWLFIPVSGYQFVHSTFLSHNHLGDFLVLPLLSSFYFLTKKIRLSTTLLILLLGIFFVFSYSRSAYLSLFLASIVMLSHILYKKKERIFSPVYFLLIIISFASFVLLFVTVREARGIPFLNSGLKYFAERNLSDKSFLATRTSYFKQAFSSIFNKPLFGVGPDNFVYASAKNAQNLGERVYTSHNIFLDIFSENGILAGVIFLGIIALFLVNSEKSLLFLLAIAALINFQTDYTFKIYSFFALFWVLAGSSYTEKINFKLEAKFVKIPSFLLASFAVLILLSNFLSMTNNYKLAFYLYPLNKDVYQSLIERSSLKKDREEENFLLALYSNFFRGDPEVLSYLGEVYKKKGNIAIALKYYERAYEANPLKDWNTVWTIYNLKENRQGEKEAKAFADRVFQKVEGVREKWSIDENFRIETMKLCQKLYNLHCPYNL